MLERCFAYHIKNNLFLSGQKVSKHFSMWSFIMLPWGLKITWFDIILCGKYADFQAKKCLDILELNSVEYIQELPVTINLTYSYLMETFGHLKTY